MLEQLEREAQQRALILRLKVGRPLGLFSVHVAVGSAATTLPVSSSRESSKPGPIPPDMVCNWTPCVWCPVRPLEPVI